MRLHSIVYRSVSLFLVMLIAVSGYAADWTTYRHDNRRSGFTSDSLTLPLNEQWVYTATSPPRPAWPPPAERPREGKRLLPRVRFDDAFQVSVSDGHLYFGSSSDTKVYCLDAATGDELWTFFTGGPVRLAPTAWKNRVLFGSDDGFAYCLDAKNGKELWKVRGGPHDKRLLGRNRMISRWPVRTGVIVEDGIAYFGAGIFPHEDVFLHAVRAEDGNPIWINDTISHMSASRNDFTPQGYMLASKDLLYIPSGRALPVAFDRETGKEVFKKRYGWRSAKAGGVIGGTYSLLVDGQLFTGTQRHILAIDRKTGESGFAWIPTRRIVVVNDMAYMSTGKKITATNLSEFAEVSRTVNSWKAELKQEDKKISRASGEEKERLREESRARWKKLNRRSSEALAKPLKWRTESDCDAALIVADTLLIAGGNGKIQIIDRESGSKIWEAHVEGLSRGLAVAHGRLYVSTDKGSIYCFASHDAPLKPPPSSISSEKDTPYKRDALSQRYETAADEIIRETGITKGYCLVIGAERGRLAYELAKRTELTIIGVESDPDKVRDARKTLDAAGLYGERVIIDQIDHASPLPYSNYCANLIMSDSQLIKGEMPGDPAALARHVKPQGGMVCLSADGGAKDEREKLEWLSRMNLGEAGISGKEMRWALLRRGALPGAGKWTHQYAEPGNTTCGDDQLVRGELGVLWFGDPGPALMVNRHNASVAPLAVNGRMLVQGENIVMAYDSYNGAELWMRQIDGALRDGLKRGECGNLAASNDSFFVAIGSYCLQLDPATGDTVNTFTVPGDSAESEPPGWGWIAYADGALYGSTMKDKGMSDSLFAIDVKSGQLMWNHQGGNIMHPTIALSENRVFFIDSALTTEERLAMIRRGQIETEDLTDDEAKDYAESKKRIDRHTAVALHAKTGDILWEKYVDVTNCTGVSRASGALSAMIHDGIIVLCGASANGHFWKQFLAGEFSRRRLVALSLANGDRLWAKDANYRHRPLIVGSIIIAEPWQYDLRTGEQLTRAHPVTGVEAPWKFLRPGHHCGGISATEHMLFFRSADGAYYDLSDDSGTRHFAGLRFGCWINAIPADGLLLAPEASAGCVCLHPIVCTVALEPRPDRQRWGIYTAEGAPTPVLHMALDLGAPGDRRDENGTLWLGFPRTQLRKIVMDMRLEIPGSIEFFDGEEFFYSRAEAEAASPPFNSGVRGIKRIVLPLQDKEAPPARYTVRLYFSDPDRAQPGKRVFDLLLQGQPVLEDFDIATKRGDSERVTETFEVNVERALEIEFIPQEEAALESQSVPILCGIEIESSETKRVTANTRR